MKNDRYYLGNQDCPPTLLAIEGENEDLRLELPWDVSGDDLIEAFYSLLTHIFSESEVLALMANECEQPSEFAKGTLYLILKTGFRSSEIALRGNSVDAKMLIHAFVTACAAATFVREAMVELIETFAKEKIQLKNEEQL